MTYVSRESECALEGYQWSRGLRFAVAAISEGNYPPQILTQAGIGQYRPN
jgi:hypothetical protein